MMEFDGKDSIMQKVAQNGTLMQKLMQYMQIALMFAQTADPMLAQQIMNDMAMVTGGAVGGPMMGGATPQLPQSDNIAGIGRKEPTIVANARNRASEASQPQGGKVTSGGKK